VDYKDLDSFLHKDSTSTEDEDVKSKKVVEALHKILRPFLLRRVKSDVEKNLLPSGCTSCGQFQFSDLVYQKRRSISMSGSQRCSVSGIGPFWKKISMPLMVSRYTSHFI
jgi:hypothetical protein